jgi:hypothetical protein
VDKPAPHDDALEGSHSPAGLPTTGCCSLYKLACRTVPFAQGRPLFAFAFKADRFMTFYPAYRKAFGLLNAKRIFDSIVSDSA